MAEINPMYPIAELTQEQYDALEVKDANTLYAIPYSGILPKKKNSGEGKLECVPMTQEDYDALQAKAENILYCIFKPPYDETKIAVVLLDENDEPTDEIEYFDTLEDSATYLKNNSSNRYLVHIGNRAGITTIFNRSFSSCTSLVKVDIPSSVNVIGSDVFSYTSLVSVTFPSSVDRIEANTFQGCASLVSADLSESTISGIRANTFYGCTALTDVTLPDTVTAISTRAFYNCISLRHIELPSSLTTIQDYAFQSCLNITFIIHKPQNSISGSPWSAINALVIWTG